MSKNKEQQNEKKFEAFVVVLVCFISQMLVNVSDGMLGVFLLEFTTQFGESEVLVAAISTCQFSVSMVASKLLKYIRI